MTKKNMLLIVLFTSVLSIVLIAVWGSMPESNSDIRVTSISFLNYELNEEEDKILNVIDDVTTETPTITLSYDYLPENAVTDFYVSSSSSEVTVIVDEETKEVEVTFTTEDSIGQNVTIRIIDRRNNEYDEITLIFKIPDIISGD